MRVQIDHLDPRWSEGEKEEEGYEQLVCGLDVPLNFRESDISDNSRKSDRFLPYRLLGDQSPPTDEGDLCLFLVGDRWVEMTYLGEEWYEETTNAGRYHHARQGRQSRDRRDGYIGWRASADPESLKRCTEKQSTTARKRVEERGKWGFMLPENKNCSAGGRTGGPRSATDRNIELREKTKIIVRDGVTIRCEAGVIAKRIVEKILEIAPECAPMSSKDVHKIWAGRVSKGWELQSIW